ncbi:MAG: helix-turn-helix domain-containing protein [Dehalococcoidia bacterium]
MNAEEWFEQELSSLENDPDFLTEELLLEITEQIYVQMEKSGVRPAELARRLGVSRAFVSQLLNGKPNMTMRTLVSVAHALDQRVHVALEQRPVLANEPATDSPPQGESHLDHDDIPRQERPHHWRRRSTRSESQL